ncbi:MAG: hypothetical protein GXO50_03645 [Chlorobi bacterium]|nr:hypothetical protein [Chlorobiota bacterium]
MASGNLKKYLEKQLQKPISDIFIFEEGIDVHTQLEFENTVRNFFKKERDLRPADILKEILYDPAKDLTEKKEALTELSLSGNVEAYRIIEKYKTVCDSKLKKWAILSFQKSRAHIEHELSDDDKIYISSGLGGYKNKLRYFFVLVSKNKKSFSDFEKNFMKKEIEFILNKHESISEKINFYDYFVSIVCLVPLHVSLEKIIYGITEETEKYGITLSEDIIATNTEIFSEDKIEEILNSDISDTNDSFFNDSENPVNDSDNFFFTGDFDDEDDFDNFDDDFDDDDDFF